MRIRTIIVVGLLALVLTVIAVWQTAACELANVELRDDLHDLSAQVSARIGLVDFNTDKDFRDAVIRKAERYDIYLQPEQITGAAVAPSKIRSSISPQTTRPAFEYLDIRLRCTSLRRVSSDLKPKKIKLRSATLDAKYTRNSVTFLAD